MLNSHEHEQALLAACLLNPEAMEGASAILKPEDFAGDVHGKAWFIALDLLRQEIEPCALAIFDEAERRGWGSEFPAAVVAELMEPAGAPSLWKYHADRILQAAKRRRLVYLARDIERLANQPHADIGGIVDDASNQLTSLMARGVEQERFRAYSSAELDAATFDTTYLIQDVLVEHEAAVVAAHKKSLKTTTQTAMALSLATGADYLNRFPVLHRRRVAMVSGETSRGAIQETARRIAASMGYDLRDVQDALWSFDLPRLKSPGELTHLRRFVKNHGVQVLIIDPAYLSLGVTGDETRNLFAMGDVLQPLTAMAGEMRLTLVMVHHLKKRQRTDAYDMPELDDMSGSGFAEWARQWIMLGRREPYDPENTGHHKLWFTTGGSSGHSTAWAMDVDEGSIHDPDGRTWRVSLSLPSNARANEAKAKGLAKERKAMEQREADRAAVLRALEQQPCGDTLRGIEKAARLSHKRCQEAVEDLVIQGAVEECDVEKNKRMEDGYRLVGVDLSLIENAFDDAGAIGANSTAL